MVRDQMVCIVSEKYERSSGLSLAEKNALSELFHRIGRIHFAAMALLPPLPGLEAPPSLLLELAVDDDLSHAELVDLLEQQGFEALWPVYGNFWKGDEHASERTRRDWLRAHLRDRLQGADGGFVGARDRSVGQILAEARLFRAARARLDTRPPAPGDDRESVARELADWAAEKQEFRWAIEPPRRSFWRARWMTTPLRVFLALAVLVLPLIAVVLVVLALVAFAGVLAIAAFHPVVDWNELIRSPDIFGKHATWAPYAVGTTAWAAFGIAVIAFLGVSGIRSLTVTAFLLLAFGLLLLLGILATGFELGVDALLDIVGAIEVLVRSGIIAILGVAAAWGLVALAFFGAMLVLPPFLGLGAIIATGVVLVAAAAWLIHSLLGCLVEYGNSISFALYPALHHKSLAGLPAIDAIVLIVLVVFSVIAYAMSRLIKLPPFTTHKVAQFMDRVKPPREPLVAGHQVHPSIDACEAELAAGGRINHMFSLTEIRRPVWLNRWLLRRFLGLVTFIGHTVFIEGKLANAEGVRFGHWHVIGRRRLLFCSNYDGAFGGYLDEFITGASEGVNLFWRWTHLRRRFAAAEGHPAVEHDRNFPPTLLGVFRGCKHEQWFKTYARDSMLPHIYRFEAYRFTAQDVERATRLREALFGPRNPVRDDQVMRALES